jgi:hypothetical protein
MFFGLCIYRARATVVDVLPVSGELQSKRRGNHRIRPAYVLVKNLADHHNIDSKVMRLLAIVSCLWRQDVLAGCGK